MCIWKVLSKHSMYVHNNCRSFQGMLMVDFEQVCFVLFETGLVNLPNFSGLRCKLLNSQWSSYIIYQSTLKNFLPEESRWSSIRSIILGRLPRANFAWLLQRSSFWEPQGAWDIFVHLDLSFCSPCYLLHSHVSFVILLLISHVVMLWFSLVLFNVLSSEWCKISLRILLTFQY